MAEGVSSELLVPFICPGYMSLIYFTNKVWLLFLWVTAYVRPVKSIIISKLLPRVVTKGSKLLRALFQPP